MNKELTEKEFKSTFTEKMNNVTNEAKAIVDIWDYIRNLDYLKYFINDYIIEKTLVDYIYRNSRNTYEQILIPTTRENVQFIIVMDLKNKNIFGHYLLDLNKEYGIKETL
jgi:hypothetical protein